MQKPITIKQPKSIITNQTKKYQITNNHRRNITKISPIIQIPLTHRNTVENLVLC